MKALFLVHTMDQRLSARESHNLGRRRVLDPFPNLRDRGPKMRSEERAVAREEPWMDSTRSIDERPIFALENIRRIPGQDALVQRVGHGLLVDTRTPGDVDEKQTSFGLFQPRSVEYVVCGRVEWGAAHEDVARA